VAVAGVDRGQPGAGLIVEYRTALLAHRGLRVLLLLQVERGVDLEASVGDRLDSEALDQLLLDVVEDERLAAQRVARVVTRAEWLGIGNVGLGARDVVRLNHRLQDRSAPLAGGGGIDERVVLRGRLRQAGQQRHLGQVELLDGLIEEHLRSRAHADRRLAPHGAVGNIAQVVVEDPVLAVALAQLLGQLGLNDLVLEVVVGGVVRPVQVAVVDQLHRERGRSLQRAALAEHVA